MTELTPHARVHRLVDLDRRIHGDVLVALQQLAKGHALIVKGSDLHYFPAFEGTVTQQSAWTFRIVRAR